MSSKVYFSKNCTPDTVVALYKKLGKELTGNVAVKIHSGEKGNQNYIHPAFWEPMLKLVNGTFVECNTAYGGARNETDKHRKLLIDNGWNALPFDLMDAEGPDDILEIPNGKQIKKNYVGRNLKKYDSMLILAHFKGHPMGGFGGALKQLSIGVASTAGKTYIHSAGRTLDQYNLWNDLPEQDAFLEAMADAASSIVEFFKGNMVFISVLKNMSVDCDCCEVAEDPCLKDIGIMISLDPVAIDQACVDMVKNSSDPGKDHFMERVNSRHGEHTIEAAEALGIGSRQYELIEID